MKMFFKFIITKILTFKAKRFLQKHKVQVIAVTGSVGKTTTKQAMYHLLKPHFDVYASETGFNTEIGLSLTILRQEESGFSFVFAWFRILKQIFTKPIAPYQKIVLEMGADQPGDIQRLVRIAPPDIGVITAVHPVHLSEGQFEDVEAISREKSQLIRSMSSQQCAILNQDNKFVREMQTDAQKWFYGTTDKADIQVSDIQVMDSALAFCVRHQNEAADFTVPVLGDFQIYTLLPAIAVARRLGLSLQDCAKGLSDFRLPPGRMNPIEGDLDTLILDGSYNASPTSMKKALELLWQLKAKRKIAALGTMNELGEMNKEAHLNLGQQASRADILVAVGPEAATIKQGAIEAKMPAENIYTFFDSEEAGYFLKKVMQAGDLILVKGSQNRVRMERLVKVIMKHPESAPRLLCRQGKAWENI